MRCQSGDWGSMDGAKLVDAGLRGFMGLKVGLKEGEPASSETPLGGGVLAEVLKIGRGGVEFGDCGGEVVGVVRADEGVCASVEFVADDLFPGAGGQRLLGLRHGCRKRLDGRARAMVGERRTRAG
jgi:hypothetical protein